MSVALSDVEAFDTIFSTLGLAAGALLVVRSHALCRADGRRAAIPEASARARARARA